MEGKAAAFGNIDFVKPFSALGLDTFVAGEGRQEIVTKAKEVIDGQYGLILVAEELMTSFYETK